MSLVTISLLWGLGNGIWSDGAVARCSLFFRAGIWGRKRLGAKALKCFHNPLSSKAYGAHAADQLVCGIFRVYST